MGKSLGNLQEGPDEAQNQGSPGRRARLGPFHVVPVLLGLERQEIKTQPMSSVTKGL